MRSSAFLFAYDLGDAGNDLDLENVAGRAGLIGTSTADGAIEAL